jgi:hypothetical protein
MITKEAFNKYDEEQIQEITHANSHGIDIFSHLNPSYQGSCIHEIALGLEHKVDTSVYEDTRYSWRKMREIRLGLEEGLDVEQYANPLYSYWQMLEIRLGLEEGLDVQKYRSLMYTAKEMHWRRMKLKNQQTFCSIEWQIETKKKFCPEIQKDGTLDFDNFQWFEPVQQNQILATYHRGLHFSESIPALGKGVRLLSKQQKLVADYNGHVRLRRNKLEVYPLVILDEINGSDTPLHYNGDVYVKGNITGPLTLEVTGDLAVDGFVEGAQITCGGNLIIKQGINTANSNATIVVRSSVICRFFEYVTLHAEGNIYFESSLNSNLSAKGAIISYGEKSGIIGGSSASERGFCLTNLGNAVGTCTILHLGGHAVGAKKSRIVIEHQIYDNVQICYENKKITPLSAKKVMISPKNNNLIIQKI